MNWSMKTKQKGTRAEYKLKKILEAQGYLIVRAAGSGHDTPDIFAFRNGEVLIFEVKSSKKDIYFREEQYTALKKFYENGFKVYIAVYNNGFKFYPFTEIEKTSKAAKLKLDKFHLTWLF